jgi:pilus assembly protein CpaE
MVIVLACDCPAKAARLRQALERSGYNCPLGNVVAVEAAGKASHKPDVVLVVLTADHEQAQADIKRVRETVDVPILAVGPRDPNLILCAVRAGANDFVDEAGDLHSELSTAICRLSTVGHGRAALGRLHTVVAASGGCGRTLLATNLAVALAKVNTRCALFDFDMGTGDVATVMDLKPLHTVADLCRNVDKLDQKMFEQSLIEHTSGVSVLAAPESWDAVSQVTVEGLEKVLRYGRTLFPTVVVDLNAFWLAEFTQLLQQSSTVFLLCRLDLPTIRNARRALEHFDRIRVNRDSVQLVAARTGRPKEIGANQAELVLDRSFDHFIPEDSSTANLCINCGVPLVVESPSCSVTKAIACIAKSAAHGRNSAAGDLAQLQNGTGSSPVMGKVRALLGMGERGLGQRTKLATDN